MLAVAAAAILLVYRLLLRPWHLRWGASDAEAHGAMPADELIADPTLVSTRAVTIEAPPERVWPWLVQLGQSRGGFYSYDWIENMIGLQIHSADRILSEHQRLERGDRIALAPDGSGLDVERVEPGRLLVLREPTGGWTWTFLLEPSDGRTRLVARNRWTTAGGPLSFRLYMALIDPAAFVMERKMLLGIKQRAERGTGPAAGTRPGAIRTQIEHQLDRRTVRLASWLLRRTGGRIARPFGRRALVLTTRGRRSGRARSVPVQYFPDGDAMVVVAANSGLPQPPAWYLNLRADPTATVELEGRRLQVRAEELPEAEATAFWPRVLATAPDYARYPERTGRRIALIRLVPIGERPTSRA
ncbi:MAG TPA: nitroreductase/quinone reductase family protein [Solirubrobacteraceae bacterium]|nr:nitroreductase/quinone reductase family protein [Solirubrobacteraceae bacterium]